MTQINLLTREHLLQNGFEYNGDSFKYPGETWREYNSFMRFGDGYAKLTVVDHEDGVMEVEVWSEGKFDDSLIQFNSTEHSLTIERFNLIMQACRVNLKIEVR